LFRESGHPVALFEARRGDDAGHQPWAGGMLAPYCER